MSLPEESPHGLMAAAATPIADDGRVDVDRYIDHCQWLLANGCDGINVLGSTGEANSLSLSARLSLMEDFAKGPFSLKNHMVGTGLCSLEETAELTREAMSLGFGGCLLLPPFYYSIDPEEGLFTYCCRLIEALKGTQPKFYLYHFPQLTGVPWSQKLIGDLLDSFPGIFVGCKDSSNDHGYGLALARRFVGFSVFPGNEMSMALEGGQEYAGCISASVNVDSRLARQVWSQVQSTGAAEPETLARLRFCRERVMSFPVVASVKCLLAAASGDAQWERVLPPQLPLSEKQRQQLFAGMKITPEGIDRA